jgi:hypothetical protein
VWEGWWTGSVLEEEYCTPAWPGRLALYTSRGGGGEAGGEVCQAGSAVEEEGYTPASLDNPPSTQLEGEAGTWGRSGGLPLPLSIHLWPHPRGEAVMLTAVTVATPTCCVWGSKVQGMARTRTLWEGRSAQHKGQQQTEHEGEQQIKKNPT